MKNLSLLLILGFTYFTGYSQAIRLQENFNAASLPLGWTNNAVTGTQTWSFGINGSATNAGNNNLDGTAMAFFDDDNLGASNTNNTVRLTSPSFDNANDISSTLEFDYNFREIAGPTDRFYVEVYDGTTWNTVFSTTSNDCGNWLGACAGNFPHANIDISAHKNANCQVRFTYHDGNDWCWYVGMDNVVVTSSVSNDLEVTSIENPQSTCSLGSTETAQVLLKNLGGNNITSLFTVTIDVDNGVQTITDTVNSTINVGDSLLYTFNSTLNLSNKAVYALKAYSSYSLDSIYGNDTATALVENITASNIPFVEDFESSTSNWITSGQNSSWQIGPPNGIVLDSAFRGNGSAVTNLTGNYNNSEQSYLETACISASQTNRLPVVSFYMKHRSEAGFDSLILESSIDDGTSWQKVNVGSISTNWYVTNSSWNGNSNGWLKVENYLDSLINQSDFKLRFTFTSDGSVNQEGFAIDNFELRYQDSTDLKIDVISYPVTSSQVCGLGTEFIKVQLTNIGQLSIDSTYLSYRVNGGTAVTDLLDSNIAALQTINYTFSTPYNFSAAATYSVDVWLSTANDNNFGNDSILNYQIVNSGLSTTIDNLPFYENFDGPLWNVGSNSLAPNWSKTPAISSNGYSWYVNSGGTNSVITGPNSDYSGTGNYLYTEASSPARMGDSAFLTTPCIRIPNTSKIVELQFYSHGFGNTIPPLEVEVNNGMGWQNVATFITHPQTSRSSPWTKRTVDLTNFIGTTIKIRFKTIHKGSSLEDLAIDEIKIEEIVAYDLSVERIISPSPSNCPLSQNEMVTVEIKNNGYEVILAGATASFVFNGITVTDSLPTSIAVDSSVIFSFTQTVDLSTILSSINLKTYTSFNLDSNYLNDTINRTIINKSISANYFENFESFVDGSCRFPSNIFDFIEDWNVNGLWNVHDDSIICTITPSPFTGPNFDHTFGNGSGTYMVLYNMGQAEDNLVSPCVDFRKDSSVELSFWYHKFGNQMRDLYIDVFSKGSWILDLDSVMGQTHYSKNDPWLLKTVALNQFAGEVIQVRFRSPFKSKFFNYNSEMAIDDVHIYNPLTVGAVEVMIQPSIQLYPNPNNGNFNLNVSNELVGKQYQVFDVKGGLVKQAIINAANSQIELSNAEKGVYFIKIEGYAKAERIVVL